MTREIPLTHGYCAIVDDEDYERVNAIRWLARVRKFTVYATNALGRKIIAMHRLILDAPAGVFVDHADGNGLNNTRGNLRLCTHAQNMQNRRNSRVAKSGYRGAHHRIDKGGKWEALIYAYGTKHWLGLYATAEDAARAYDAKARELHGEFAVLNFPGETLLATPVRRIYESAWTPELIEQIKALRADGVTWPAVKTALGLSCSEAAMREAYRRRQGAMLASANLEPQANRLRGRAA